MAAKRVSKYEVACTYPCCDVGRNTPLDNYFSERIEQAVGRPFGYIGRTDRLNAMVAWQFDDRESAEEAFNKLEKLCKGFTVSLTRPSAE